LLDGAAEGRLFIEDDLGIFASDRVVRDVIEMEKRGYFL
jgi:hypothetical protein